MSEQTTLIPPSAANPARLPALFWVAMALLAINALLFIWIQFGPAGSSREPAITPLFSTYTIQMAATEPVAKPSPFGRTVRRAERTTARLSSSTIASLAPAADYR
jgi:hypothetical protein